jgi:hypothetical protein
MMAISEKYTAIISGEASAAEAGKQRLAVQEQILETTRQQELATMRV